MEQEEKVPCFFRFEELRVYAKANDYAAWVMLQFEKEMHEGGKQIAAGMCRSAFDISLNIAEGSSRNKSQFEHYLKIAKTAIRECVVYTELASRTTLFNEEQTQHSRDILMELTRMVGALIISLQRVSERRSSTSDDENDNYGENSHQIDEMVY